MVRKKLLKNAVFPRANLSISLLTMPIFKGFFLGPTLNFASFSEEKKFTSWKGKNPTVYEPLSRAGAKEKTLSNFTDS